MGPEKILVVGDTHGNLWWLLQVIYRVPELLAGETEKVIVQAGDFMFTGSDEFLSLTNDALKSVGAYLLWVDGNHEDHDLIASWREPGYPETAAACPLAGGKRMTRIYHLPRGHRWEWQGRTWLACGGAASPDRCWRTEGRSWWPQEYITDADVDRCIAGGPADVLISHDRPAAAWLSLPPWRQEWDVADLARSDASRDQVQRICEGTGVKDVIHGHYHLPFSWEQHDLGYGPVRVSQLHMDGYDDNYRVLNIMSMEWE